MDLTLPVIGSNSTEFIMLAALFLFGDEEIFHVMLYNNGPWSEMVSSASLYKFGISISQLEEESAKLILDWLRSLSQGTKLQSN